MFRPNKNIDIRYDIDGSFNPWVVYAGEDEDLDSKDLFNSYSTKEDATEAAEIISSLSHPVDIFVKVFYMPDKRDCSVKEEVWSKYVKAIRRSDFRF